MAKKKSKKKTNTKVKTDKSLVQKNTTSDKDIIPEVLDAKSSTAENSLSGNFENDSSLIDVIKAVLFVAFILFSVLRKGVAGAVVGNILSYLFGSSYPFLLFILLIYFLIKKFSGEVFYSSFFGSGIALLCITIMLTYSYHLNNVNTFESLKDYSNMLLHNPIKESIINTGGIIGNSLYVALYTLISREGTIILIIFLYIISTLMIFSLSGLKSFFSYVAKIVSNTADGINNYFDEKEELAEKEKQERIKRQKEIMKVQLAEQERLKKEKIRKEVLSNSPTFINLSDEEIGFNDDEERILIEEEGTDLSISDISNTGADVSSCENGKSVKSLSVSKKTNSKYKLPKPLTDFLDDVSTESSSVNKTAAEIKGKKVIEILKTFDIDAKLVKTYIGPSVTKFEIKPDSSVKINKILNLQDNIKMELAAKEIRIEAPIPGKSAVGIEIPNAEMVPVRMLDMMKSIPSELKSKSLLYCIGKDLSGKCVYGQIDKYPHALVSGATGTGKSVGINALLVSLLMRCNPSDVKLVLIDPKRVEFTPYKDIPHLLFPIINDSSEAVFALKKIVNIMEDRYDLMAECGVRKLDDYNSYVEDYNSSLKDDEKPLPKLPYIIVIIDELADLMLIAGKDVEMSIQRITQLARAAGIHLFVATQRPSTDVITGLIKSNIPTRIAYTTSSSIDSRTILDQTGAERLLGNGDMLYFPQGTSAPERLQGVFVSDKEIRKVTDFVKSQAEPEYDDSYYAFINNCKGTVMCSSGSDSGGEDSLYDDVVEFVREQQKASTSLLQRRFGIGYNRAARLIDTLEDRGIIGPSNGSKPREVFVKKDIELL